MSIAARALLALLLTIVFYVLACGIAVALLAVVVLEFTVADRISLRLTLFCVAGAGLIVWSVAPRRHRFTPPGPLLDLSAHPRLRQELQDVAAHVGEPMPREVYANLAVNASVLERGGLLGIGSRRVIVLGLPLLQLLTVSEFRAVLAHEFGHYHGGDTAIGPWVYRTRESIVRTVRHVDRFSSVLRLPFRWYGLLFLRITQAVSRAEEYAADALAARAVGARALTAALRKLEGGVPAFEAYWSNEFVPVVNAGLRPPLADGFAHFLNQDAIRRQLDRIAAEESDQPASGPYDSHPPTAARIAALAALPPGPEAGEEPAAISMIDDLPAIEQVTLGGLLRPGVAPPRPLAWDQVGVQLLLPAWQQRVQEHRALLGGVTVAGLPARALDAAGLGYRIPNASGSGGADWARDAGIGLLGAGLGVALAGQGWTVDSQPGEPVNLRWGRTSFDPVQVVRDMAEGRMDAASWERWCREAGVADVPLG